MNRKDLARWLTQNEAHPWTRADLRQVLSAEWETADKVAPVRTWTRPGLADLGALASEVIDTVIEDANDTGGLCRYRVVLVGEDSEVFSRKEFDQLGERTTEKSGVAEPATMSGHLAQMMRHNEAMARNLLEKDRLMLASHTETNKTLTGILSLISARNEELERGRIEALQSMEEMLSLKNQRDIATKRLEVDLNYKAATFDKIIPALPIVVNKLLSRNLLPEDPAAFDGLEALLLSLKDTQLNELQKVLTPEQMFSFVKLWEALAKRIDEREKKEAAAKAEREKTTNGKPATA